MRTPRITAAVAVAAMATILTVTPSPAEADAGSIRMNEIQAIGTHNSYHRELSFPEKLVQRQNDASAWNLEYSHASLPVQFDSQQVRGLEIDLFPDPEGALYADPLVRHAAGLLPLAAPEYQQPGFKVMHLSDHDYGTACILFTQCLRQIRDWSRAHRTHVPIFILLEAKTSASTLEALGAVHSPRWDGALLEAVDAEIRSVFRENEIITPDDIRRPGKTLEQSVLEDGWPTLRKVQGQVMFMMNQSGSFLDEYKEGRPSLEGRVLFTNSRPGRPDAAVIGYDDPLGANLATIQDFVRRGYIVRTRSDVPFGEAETGDTTRLRAALDSGAQTISTDFPVAGLAARYGSDYVAQIPGGYAARCNPVNAARSCHPAKLER